MTTGSNTVRFNPNFYRNGKVCLSILGTWTGPAWSPAQSISSVLISIQSLMTENPYHNEPGFEQERHPGDSKNYNECIRHESLRVAVCDMLDGKCPCPEALRSVMEKSFMEFYDFYELSCKDRLHLQGQTMQSHTTRFRNSYYPSTIRKEIQEPQDPHQQIQEQLLPLNHQEGGTGASGPTPPGSGTAITPQPSGRRYWSLRTHTTRFRNSYYPSTIRKVVQESQVPHHQVQEQLLPLNHQEGGSLWREAGSF
ncbi:ubiquitin-conjugating enzyme E2 Z isoform X2 [Mobula birostris]|uniref:ubiquitin-conjugating enzyme E2 Z isoform X2 n=1 Tax=Mobula birostris TaxID=1983395 RepID=UPI003B288105